MILLVQGLKFFSYFNQLIVGEVLLVEQHPLVYLCCRYWYSCCIHICHGVIDMCRHLEIEVLVNGLGFGNGSKFFGKCRDFERGSCCPCAGFSCCFQRK